MNSFVALPLNSESYCFLVISTSYRNPLEEKAAIQKELKKYRAKGEVLFDLLLSHGDTPDRFYCAYFDGKKLAHGSTCSSVSAEAKKILEGFLQNNLDLLDNSILSKPQRFILKNRMSY